MVSNEDTASLSYKSKYKELKRKLKYLAYENECFEADIKDAQAKLLQISREKSYLLDQLMSHETIIISEESDPESTDYTSDDYSTPQQSLHLVPPSDPTRPTKPSSGQGSSPKQRPLARARGSGRKAPQRSGNKQSAITKKSKPPPPSSSSSVIVTAAAASNSVSSKPTSLSLVVSLPRPGPAHSKPGPPPVRSTGKTMAASAPKKHKRGSSSNSTSGSSSSSTDSDSQNNSSSSDNESVNPPPPPLRLVDSALNSSNQVVVPKLIHSPPVSITSLPLVPSLSLPVTSSSSLPSQQVKSIATPPSAPKIFVSVGEGGLSAFHVVKPTMPNSGDSFQER